MRILRGTRTGFLLACIPILNMGCATLSPKFGVLPSVAKNRADVQFQAAQTAEQKGQWQKARELYIALQRSSPNTAVYAHRTGVVCTQLGDFETAGKYFEHARKLDPQNAALLSDMGYSHYLQKDFARAESLLNQSVQLDPDDARAVNNLAMAIGFQGRYEESLLMFARVNTESQALLNLAFIYSQQNDLEQAAVTYERVLQGEPNNRVAISALQQLQVMRRPVQEAKQAPLVANAVATSQDMTAGSTFDPAVSSMVRPLITSAAEMPQRLDFPAPLITPFAAGAEAVAVIEEPKRSEEPARIKQDSAPAELPELSDENTELKAAVAPQFPFEVDSTPESKQDTPPAASPPDTPPVTTPSVSDPTAAATETEEVKELEVVKEVAPKESTDAKSAAEPFVRKDDCFKGFCPVAIRDERRLRTSHSEFAAEHNGKTYWFHSAEAQTAFREHPDWYVPYADGLDSVAAQRSQAATTGSLDYAVWFRHRLHMFSSAENLAAFRQAPRQFAPAPRPSYTTPPQVITEKSAPSRTADVPRFFE